MENKNKTKVFNKKDNKRRPLYVKAKIDRINEDENSVLRAYASVNVAGAVAIHGLRVMESESGLFVSMPSRSYTDRNGEKQYADIAHPITAEARTAINDSVLKAYDEALKEVQGQSEDELGDELDEDDLPFEQSM